MKLESVILSILMIFVFFSCGNDPGFDETPEITYTSISKDTMVQNNLNTDSIFITFAFKDGDGDIGTDNRIVSENIIVTDLRTGIVASRFNIPKIETNGLKSGVEGEITVKVFTTCCIFQDGTPPCSNPVDTPENSLNFEIELSDDNGNRSNKITTEFITLLCN